MTDRQDRRANNGGARPGAGALQVRLRLDRETAQCLRVLTLARRGVSGRTLTPDDVATDLIRAAYTEYEAGITSEGE